MTEEINPGLRRLPVYMVLDTSWSMAGEPIEALRMGMRSLLDDLQTDPQALETVWLSVITFDSTAKQLVPLTGIDEFSMPDIKENGTTSLGAALDLVIDCADREIRKTTDTVKGDYKPLIFLMTDGAPTDNWEKAADRLKQRRLGNIISCAAGPGADDTVLKRITEIVVRLENTSAGTLGAFMKWVSDSIAMTSASVSSQAPGDAVALPPPPKDQGIVIVP
ncbi:VWA domain-containing protein [Akkermansiaceae bacterium]|nr:VWA domain-containing protein [Akkermansiaceae bacterium]